MTQTAQVKRLLTDGRAEVSVHRKTACSHDCSKCSGCELTITSSDLTVNADNHIGSKPGDVVLVESSNSDILGAAVVVYLVPFVLFFAGYLITQALSLGEGISILISFLCLIVGLLPARFLDRKVREKTPMNFRVIEILKSCSDI